METIRKGSRGEAVKTLQRALHVVPDDGIFGIRTEEAVKALQRRNGLSADGIVGAKTWAALLGGDNGSLNIIKAFIHTHITYAPNRPLKYIAIHYTAGASSRSGSAYNTRKVFLSRPASADFIVDDAQIVQVNPDIRSYYCWAVGDKKNPYTGGGRLNGVATNKNTISIEICSNLKSGMSAAWPNHGGWYFTDASLGKALELVRYLMKTYGIPKGNVIRHYDVSGKLCPAVVGWNDGEVYSNSGKPTGVKSDSTKWLEFINKI